MLQTLFLVGAVNLHNETECDIWANRDECSKNPGFMLNQCQSSCEKFGVVKRSYEARCPMKKDKGVLKPNEMQKIFDDILKNYPELEPELVSKDPPMIVFDAFASYEETNAFIEYGQGKYTRSTGLEMKKDGSYGSVQTPIRTSANTWCQEKKCLENELIANVTQRVSLVTQTPERNFEFAQLLYYHSCEHPAATNCSFYKRHHDYIASDIHKNQGVRIFTCFIYLNDVEEGGSTVFDVGISVKPKKGRAVLWPSVKMESPHESDERTYHEALPVTKGEKFAANFWIHQYDFKTPHAKGCTM